MNASEWFMSGGIIGFCLGVAVAVMVVSKCMIPETTVIMLQDKLRRAIGAVRTAQINLSVTDYGEALTSAERLLEAAGVILRTDLRDEGDR